MKYKGLEKGWMPLWAFREKYNFDKSVVSKHMSENKELFKGSSTKLNEGKSSFMIVNEKDFLKAIDKCMPLRAIKDGR